MTSMVAFGRLADASCGNIWKLHMFSSPAARGKTRRAQIVMKSILNFIKKDTTDSMRCKFKLRPLGYTLRSNLWNFHRNFKLRGPAHDKTSGFVMKVFLNVGRNFITGNAKSNFILNVGRNFIVVIAKGMMKRWWQLASDSSHAAGISMRLARIMMKLSSRRSGDYEVQPS